MCVSCLDGSQCATGVCSDDNTCVECLNDSQCGQGLYKALVCNRYDSTVWPQFSCGECALASIDCPYRMTCSIDRRCTCSNDLQCGGDAPVCFQDRCQGCPGQTAAGDQYCQDNNLGSFCSLVPDSERYVCTECDALRSCPYNLACRNNVCVCSVDADCGPGEYCTEQGRCIQCRTEFDCSQTAGRPICNRNMCVQCRDGTDDCLQIDPRKPYCMNSQCSSCNGTDSSCSKTVSFSKSQCSASGECVAPCMEDGDCVSKEYPYCYQGTCSACRPGVSSDCPSGYQCFSDQGAQARCVECVSDTPGACPSGYLCYNNVCSECISDNDCSKESPLCSGNRCVQCIDGSQCPPTAPICGTDGRCHACANDFDCSPLFPYCSDSGVCTQCSVNNMEACSEGLVCDKDRGMCVACLNEGLPDPLCPRNKIFCSQGRCEQCISDAQCPNENDVCVNGECRRCTSPDQCSWLGRFVRQQCNPTTYECEPII